MKKIRIELMICIIIAVALLCFWGVKKIYNYYLYKMTVVEVHKLNESSDFFGHKLLGNPPKDSGSYLPERLKDLDSDDIYYAGEYHKSYGIIAMDLVSYDANLMGIAPGDDKDVIKNELHGTAFKKAKSPSKNTIRYIAYHIILDFEITDSGSIKCIGISIQDPEDKMDYN